MERNSCSLHHLRRGGWNWNAWTRHPHRLPGFRVHIISATLSLILSSLLYFFFFFALHSISSLNNLTPDNLWSLVAIFDIVQYIIHKWWWNGVRSLEEKTDKLDPRHSIGFAGSTCPVYCMYVPVTVAVSICWMLSSRSFSGKPCSNHRRIQLTFYLICVIHVWPYEVRLIQPRLCISNRIAYGKWSKSIYLPIGVTLWKIICTLLITNMANVIVMSSVNGPLRRVRLLPISFTALQQHWSAKKRRKEPLAECFSKNDCIAVAKPYLLNRVCHLAG